MTKRYTILNNPQGEEKLYSFLIFPWCTAAYIVSKRIHSYWKSFWLFCQESNCVDWKL